MFALPTILALASLIAINSAGNSPRYDYSFEPGDGDEGECRFKGTIETGGTACTKITRTREDFKQNADLTWKILSKACPSLVYAGCADPDWAVDEEHNMDDLVWRSCSSCPRCSCNNGNPKSYYLRNYTSVASTRFKYSICYQCDCKEWYKDEDDKNIFARDCDPESYTYSALTLKEGAMHCPETTPQPTPQPTGGCDDGAGNSRAPGEYFFIYDADQNCDTYCFCNSTNGLECEETWDNIIASEELKYNFYDDCGTYLQDAFNDTSRYGEAPGLCTNNKAYFYPIYRCPRVTCGTYTDGNKWDGITYEETVYDTNDNADYVLYNCGNCQCYINGFGGADLQVNCLAYDYKVTSSDDCTVSSLTCEDYNSQSGFDECAEGAGETYCGWKQLMTPDGFDPDTVCIEDDIETPGGMWGCQNDYLCEAFYGYDELQASGNGFCSYNKVSFTAKTYDCINYKWLTETYELDTYTMCCKKKDGIQASCNTQKIISKTALGEDNECTGNAVVNEYVKKIYECGYGARGQSNKDYIKEFECGVALPEGKHDSDSDVCSRISAHWKYNTICECKWRQVLEKTYPSDDHHNDLRKELQYSFDDGNEDLKATLQAWADIYDCSSTFECDITDKAINGNNVYILSFLFVFVIKFML